jgi:hypothetical protein
MNKYVLIASLMSLFLSSAAIAQHGGPNRSSALAPASGGAAPSPRLGGYIVKATGVGRS